MLPRVSFLKCMIEKHKEFIKKQDLLFFVQVFWHFLLCFCFDLAVSTTMYECIGVKFVNTIKVLPDVTCYLTTFVQKSQKSLVITC